MNEKILSLSPSMLPESWGIMPPIIFSNEVLPHPEGPNIVLILFSERFREKFLYTSTSPNDLLIFFSFMLIGSKRELIPYHNLFFNGTDKMVEKITEQNR